MDRVMAMEISSLEDRKTVTGILHANGYTVRPAKIKKSAKGYGYLVEFWRDDDTLRVKGENDESC